MKINRISHSKYLIHDSDFNYSWWPRGRGGRHMRRVLKADLSGVASRLPRPRPLPTTRNERKFISYLTCGGEEREGEREGRRGRDSPHLSLSPIFYPVRRAKRILSFFTSFAASQRAPNSNFAPYRATTECGDDQERRGWRYGGNEGRSEGVA